MGHWGFAAFYLLGGLAALARANADRPERAQVPTVGSEAIAAVLGGYAILYPERG